MQDAIAALESALASLELARAEMPDDLRTELDSIVDQARNVLRSLSGTTGGGSTSSTGGAGQAGATG